MANEYSLEQMFKYLTSQTSPTPYDMDMFIGSIGNNSRAAELWKMVSAMDTSEFEKLPSSTKAVLQNLSNYSDPSTSELRPTLRDMRKAARESGLGLPSVTPEGYAEHVLDRLNNSDITQSQLDALYAAHSAGGDPSLSGYYRTAYPLYQEKLDAERKLWDEGSAATRARIDEMINQLSAESEATPQVPSTETSPVPASRGMVPVGNIQTLREATPTVGYSHTQSPFGSMVSDRRKVWQVDQDTVANPERVYNMAVPNPKSLKAATRATAPAPAIQSEVSAQQMSTPEALAAISPTPPTEALPAAVQTPQVPPPIQQMSIPEAIAELSSTAPAEELTAAVQQPRAAAPVPQATPKPSTASLASAARRNLNANAADIKLPNTAPSKAELLSELASTSTEAPKMLKGLRNPSAAASGVTSNKLGDLATKLGADTLSGVKGGGSPAAGGSGASGGLGALSIDPKTGVSLGGKNVGKWMGGIGIGMNAVGALGELDKMSKEGARTGDLSNDVINASLASPMATYNLTPDQLKLLGDVRAGRVKNDVDAGDFDMSGMLSGALSGGLTGMTGGIPMAITGALVGGAKGGMTGLTQAKARKNAELEALYQALNQSNADYRARMQSRIDSRF